MEGNAGGHSGGGDKAAAREDMVRIGNLSARREASLHEAASASQSRAPSLAEYLATKRKEAAEA